MYRIDINTRKLKLYLFKNGILIKKYPVSVGKRSTLTPLGHWIIIKKGTTVDRQWTLFTSALERLLLDFTCCYFIFVCTVAILHALHFTTVVEQFKNIMN